MAMPHRHAAPSHLCSSSAASSSSIRPSPPSAPPALAAPATRAADDGMAIGYGSMGMPGIGGMPGGQGRRAAGGGTVGMSAQCAGYARARTSPCQCARCSSSMQLAGQSAAPQPIASSFCHQPCKPANEAHQGRASLGRVWRWACHQRPSWGAAWACLHSRVSQNRRGCRDEDGVRG